MLPLGTEPEDSSAPSDLIRRMKQIHVWPNHIRLTHLDLVLYRPHEEPLDRSLSALARLGFDVRPDNVEVHEEIPAA